MALKRQVTTIEEIPEAFREHYKPVEGGVGFALEVEGDEDTGALKRALDRVRKEKEEAIALAKQRGEDVANIENSWKTKVEDAEKAHKDSLAKTTQALKRATIDRETSALATKLAGDAADLLIPVIERRIKVELDGDRAITRILDSEGKASALTLSDLENEIRSDKRFSRIVIASKASGSGAGSDRDNLPAGGASTEGFDPIKNTSTAAHFAWIAERKSKRGA